MPSIKRLKAGKWGKVEHDRFMKALQKHGKNWIQIQKSVKSRTLAQVRSHAQKTFQTMPSEQFNRLQHSINKRHLYFCKQSSDSNSKLRQAQKKLKNAGKKESSDSPKISQGNDQNPQLHQKVVLLQEGHRNQEQHENKLGRNFQSQGYNFTNLMPISKNMVQEQPIINSNGIYNLQWVPLPYYYYGFNFQIQD